MTSAGSFFADAASSPLDEILTKISGGQETPFIHRLVHVLPAAMAHMPYALARFRLDMFNANHYATHGVRMPIHIRNSVAKRQAEYLAGRVCAQTALSQYGAGDGQVAVGAHREPLWPEGFIGSITHNGQYAAAIACPSHYFAGIGIDIESVIGADARQAMLDLTVSTAELSNLRGIIEMVGLDRVLTLTFSAKESFFKAAFSQVRRFFDFDAVQVIDVDWAHRVLSLRCVQTLASGLPVGRIHAVHFDMLGSSSVFTVVALKDSGRHPVDAGSGAHP